MKNFSLSLLAGASVSLFLCGDSTCLAQGSLTPPGPPGPAMKTLDQIDAKLEKRTPISILPYAISTSGSYYVTKNLTGVSGQDGIKITASNVTVDLNGFTLTGAAGAKIGIHMLGGVSGVSVSNGSVNGWPSGGVVALDESVSKPATGCRFTALHSSGNSGPGLDTGYAAVVRDCTVEKNAGTGMNVGEGSTVDHCNSNRNTGLIGVGFHTYMDQPGSSGSRGPSVFNSCNATGNSSNGFGADDSVLTGCVAYNNVANGFAAGKSSLRNCVAAGNQGVGIFANDGSAGGCVATDSGTKGFETTGSETLTNCTARANAEEGFKMGFGGGSATACSASFNGGAGIDIGEGSSAVGCTSFFNTEDGIKASSACYVARCNADSNKLAGVHATMGSNRIEGNQVTNNVNGIKVDAPDNLIYGNTARGNTGAGGNYSIIAGNRVGTIVTPNVSITISGSVGGAGFGSTDPWINIAF